jgi:hypothetical protein
MIVCCYISIRVIKIPEPEAIAGTLLLDCAIRFSKISFPVDGFKRVLI